VSVANKMTVEFTSDVETQMAGFIAYWDRVPPNGTVSGYIQSPSYPNNYEICENERWVLQAPKGSKIRVDFLDFQTEPRYDRVRLIDGLHSRFDLGYPFDQDQDSPRCQEDYYYYYDYYDYYDYRNEDEESKKVQRQKQKNNPNKNKLKESAKNESTPKINKRRPYIKKEENKKEKDSKKIKKNQKGTQRNSKKTERKKINKKNGGRPSRKPSRKPSSKPGGKPGGRPSEKPSRKPSESRVPETKNFTPDQIVADLSGTLTNFTYISNTNTMSIFWASDFINTRKGFKLVYNIIES